MNWFDTSGLTSLAKTALKEAQKTIDKALDIQDESGEEQEDELDSSNREQAKASQSQGSTPQKDSDFFSSWGLTVSAESDSAVAAPVVVTESPSKSAQSMWGSFAGSFFEQPKTDTAIVQPPKAKSMDVIVDAQFGSHDDLFAKSQLVMSDSEGLDYKVAKKVDAKVEERRGSSRSNVLSLMSSQHSSDSVEVLSQSLKTTPDSEASIHSISQCSSSQRHNSESVEILPDSLVSPSSIECLGFDSYTSDKTSSTSSMLSPGDFSNKKSTPIGDRTEKAETADSVSLVADDDEDTMSYNSVSECTAPTVLDTDDKVSFFPKLIKTEPRKGMERELMNLEHSVAILPQKLLSENSSNDGSSDRTLNADNDSLILENTIEEEKKELEREQDDILSDSSSFYNVNVSSEMLRSESSAFVEVEKRQCSTHSSASSHKDGSSKERTSPISSDSKSDLVKIGSDRTSGHTSGDEVETATSSDIEIIPSPNSDVFCRTSPAKYGFKNGKFDGSTSPNLVDLVLGKSLATKIRGHTRELSETSVISNTSDESQSSENERLMRRLCEMAEILDARENRLMEVSRSNAELAESNAELKTQVESLLSKHEVGDISLITEDYTQRMSALEKKFQQAIREKDNLRKQLDSLKSKNSSDLENTLKEKDDMIAQLHEEGEKLSKQQLQHSNIIKKLRAKEKDNEQVIKGLRDKIAEQTAEMDRLKRSVAAKEELEVTQIEAVYRLTTTNKKLEAELMETRSALDDANQRLESSRTSLDAARRELAELQRSAGELQRLRGQRPALQERADAARAQADALRAELAQLRADMVAEEKRWVSREEALRRELREAREACAALEAAGDAPAHSGALLEQLAELQGARVHAQRAHAARIAELEQALLKACEREKVSREECRALGDRLSTAEQLVRDTRAALHAAAEHAGRAREDADSARAALDRKSAELESAKSEYEAQVASLKQALHEAQQRLAELEAELDLERKRNVILQEQASCRGDVSPPHSVSSDTFSTSLHHSEDGGWGGYSGSSASALQVEETLALARRREGEVRALAAAACRLRRERAALQQALADTQHALDTRQNLQEQYDALLQMYGEKEEQVAELKLDLQDVTQLYKAQLDELVALKRAPR